MDDFREYLRSALGKRASREELAVALDVSASTIDRRKAEFSLDEILTILDYYGLSRTGALIALGVLNLRDVMDSVGADGALVDTTSDAELARELARRLSANDPEFAASDRSGRLRDDRPDTGRNGAHVGGKRAAQVRKDLLS